MIDFIIGNIRELFLFGFRLSFKSLNERLFQIDAITVSYLLHDTLLTGKGGSLLYSQMLTFTTFACSYGLFLSPENFTTRTPVTATYTCYSWTDSLSTTLNIVI